MEDIIKFSGILRENGISASVRSTINACEAVNLLKNSDTDLKSVLAAVYLKNHMQIDKFDKLYESFFLKGESNTVSSKFEVEKSNNLNNQNRSIQTNKMKKTLNYHLNTLKDHLNKDQKIEYLEKTLGRETTPNDKNIKSNLSQSNLSCLNSLQPELLELCQELGRKLASKRARRNKKAKKQTPDIRRSIRKNLKNGGTLIELIKSKPKIKKQNHYFLSDVSVSCDWISLWFFCLIYAARNTFNQTRAFEFDNKTVEITSALDEQNLIDAFLNVLDVRKKTCMIQGKSNMYTAFESFLKQSNLNNKSYVMILSDCRDWAGPKNGDKPVSADLIREISKISKKVMILNPEAKSKWDVADSCISSYGEAGAEIHEVRNLEQLADLISNI